jgi:hypothetical protein
MRENLTDIKNYYHLHAMMEFEHLLPMENFLKLLYLNNFRPG